MAAGADRTLRLRVYLWALWAASLGCALCVWAPCARADRIDHLVLAAEVRAARAWDGSHQTWELAFPHGLAVRSEMSELLVRVAWLLPVGGVTVNAFPVGLGWSFIPDFRFVQPLAGVELGGTFVAPSTARGVVTNSEWVWTLRGLLGVHLNLWRYVGVRAACDVRWAQQPEQPQVEAAAFGGWGLSSALVFSPGTPQLGLLDRVVHGTGMAEDGW